MRRKNIAYMMVTMLAMSTLFGCSKDKNTEGEENATTGSVAENNLQKESQNESQEEVVVEGSIDDIVVEYDDEDYTKIAIKGTEYQASDDITVLESTEENTIYLKGTEIDSKAAGVSVEGTTVKITAPGTYVVTGELSDGQIQVDCAEKGSVVLVLNNASVSNKTNSPVYIKDSSKTLIVLAENSENSLEDATEYSYLDTENEEPSACLFSKEDLVISGNGSLNVKANFNNGIASKDTLKITGGTITVDAKNNGIKGKDCLQIAGGVFDVTSLGDGLQSDNEDLASAGFVNISAGEFKINAGEDGIQAFSQLMITGGTFDVVTGKGSASVTTQRPDFGFGNAGSESEDSTSIKGLKGGLDITITGGEIHVDAEDDAIHSDGTCTVEGGMVELASGDDGIHAENKLSIKDGTINITKSYEGVESPEIVFDGGITYIVASDDGTNAAGGELTGGNAAGGFGGKKGGMMSTSTGTMAINDGYIYINSGGDGLDANGNLTVNGGTVLVEGPTNDGNSAVDYDGNFVIAGGTLLASGSSGMVEGVSGNSTQNTVCVYFNETLTKDSTFALLDENKELVAAYTVSKDSGNIIFSSDKLVEGKTYTVMYGGTCVGETKDGLCENGTYSGGTELETITISSVVTTIGSGGHMGGNQMHGDQMGGGHKEDFFVRPDEMETPEGFEMPSGMEPPSGMERPEGMEMPSGMEPPQGFGENIS